MPKEEIFPTPVKYFDVTRSTHTDLDVLLEKQLDDHWNVDSNRHLSDSWKRILYPVEREASKSIHVVRKETDKDSNDCQTRSWMARIMDEDW